MSAPLRRLRQLAAISAVAVAVPSAASAAESVSLYLKANGVDVRGDSTLTSLGREGSIECIAFHTVARPTVATKTVTCRKRIDRSSPLLLKALRNRETVTFTFKLFRPNPTNDGTTEQFYTVTNGDAAGRIASIEQVSPNNTDPANVNLPPMESVVIEVGALCATITTPYTTQCF